MKRIYKSFKQKLNESRKEYNKIVLGEQSEEDIRSDFDPRGGGGEESPEMMPPPTCHTNARKIEAWNCENTAWAMWGCATVDGTNTPQVGQVIEGFGISTATGIPVYYEITSVDPQDPSMAIVPAGLLTTLPNAVGCGWDCDMNNGTCGWNPFGNATYTDYNTCTSNCIPPIPGCTDPAAQNYDPNATQDDGSCIFPCMKVTLINTCPQNSSYSTYYGTPGVPSPGGTWNMNWGQGPNFGCATIDGQTPDTTNLQTFIEGGTGVPGEQWEVFSIEPPTSNYVYNLNTTSC